jgi:hypothetical protein
VSSGEGNAQRNLDLLLKRMGVAAMLEIYEDGELMKRIQGERVEIKAVGGYLVWLELMAGDMTILRLYLSSHQLGRLGKYLSSRVWRGGAMCPQKSEPEGCDIEELDDQAKYHRILEEIEYHRKRLDEYRDAPSYMTDHDRRMIPNLEIEALLLKDSAKFGLKFVFVQAKPYVYMHWVPEDTTACAARFLEAARVAYNMREPESETMVDLTDWKRKLFEV